MMSFLLVAAGSIAGTPREQQGFSRWGGLRDHSRHCQTPERNHFEHRAERFDLCRCHDNLSLLASPAAQLRSRLSPPPSKREAAMRFLVGAPAKERTHAQLRRRSLAAHFRFVPIEVVDDPRGIPLLQLLRVRPSTWLRTHAHQPTRPRRLRRALLHRTATQDITAAGVDSVVPQCQTLPSPSSRKVTWTISGVVCMIAP
jgi:hypothetical protein